LDSIDLRGVVISVMKGDITQLNVDAVVNPANTLLWMGGGVAGAIKRAGGNIIEEEAVRRGPIPIGEAIATTAGKLKAKYVIHAPTMELPAQITDAENVYRATKAALKCANDLKIQSIAIPGMGTGVGRVKPRDAAESIIRAIKEHIHSETGLKSIILIDINDEMVKSFRDAIREIS
ncbi:MAG: macro domain-containing protein, partial [Nitrososphaerales archaeon]|nr:macro domain-containing protein [Nitrososphaerales archaeon]